MISAISNAINSGQNAVNSVISSSSTTTAAIATVATATVLDLVNKCLGIDVIAMVMKWLKEKFCALRKKLFSGVSDKNSKIGKIINAFKRIYKAITGAISAINDWIQTAYKHILKVIQWINDKIDIIRQFLNNPCARALAAQANVNLDDVVPGNITVPVQPRTIELPTASIGFGMSAGICG